MSKRIAKSELVDLMTGPKKTDIHIIIYAYNGCYKSHDITNKKRHAIDTLTEKEAKLLVKDPQYAIMFFQLSGKKDSASWVKKVGGCVIPVDPTKEKLLEDFFNYEFPPVDYASPAEYYKAGPPPGYDLYRGVTKLWGDYINALAIERGLH